ncbi:anaerobic nitric oxide reductase flavorubredoxin [Clostridium cylindrosporum]|uniref:Anaerobic nitric oxide reductase flavorubredoxin NorV n=1 Tax=Clostridium cylindrosporum DSM 605 TaxID=1121307 RepID=A0A0J8D5P1_CLOCY|nr:anaerobic nitric oxide reductase flavorubredoxin [Clostridium cylindrosporum]KMT21162.1 anaerobic nitric oxide reductase flavorubredoxin NorV [Clostridium cylindrosporum DSM 605]
MSFKINNTVTWVGKMDWELRKFHGEEYSTHRGSSYNSYLIKDEKTVLIDTVWQAFTKEFIANLEKEIDLKKIDFIVANHSEIDHSGALPELMRLIPNTPIYCTKTCAKLLKAHYHQDWNFVEVKTGDTLEIGKNKLMFIEAKMLHWPDSMFTYLTGENILFSSDAFGQHFASELMYSDKVDSEGLLYEAMKYYTNILTPFNPLVKKKIEELLSLGLPINMICPGHGIIWRDNPSEIIKTYLEWSKNYKEDQVTIIYDTMWNSTRRMAETIAEGLKEIEANTTIKILSSSKYDKNDIVTEVFKSKAILIGSSTINKGILSSTAAILEMIKGLGFKEKKAAAFGSYGWSGESVRLITEELTKAGLEVVNEGIREEWIPGEAGLDRCRDFGRNFGEKIK